MLGNCSHIYSPSPCLIELTEHPDHSGPQDHHSENDENLQVETTQESLQLIPTDRPYSYPGAHPGINSRAYSVVVVVVVLISLLTIKCREKKNLLNYTLWLIKV